MPSLRLITEGRLGLWSVVSGFGWLRAGVLLFFVLALGGCNTAAIYQDDAYNPPVYWGRHVVKPGETLYSIAWRYGRDYRELGNANNIGPPWDIKPGRVLRLDRRGKVVADSQQRASPAPAPGPRKSPGRAAPTQKASVPPKVQKAPSRNTPLPEQTQMVAGIKWQWPHVGTVIAGFSASGKVNKGIDIAGKAGDPVRTSAAGNVVYAGSGLLGYGNLIIVNHNEHFLSAYAHNRRILVREGEDVKAGQVIAELGSTGTDRNKLHFEIRKNGNPVDPVPYLPPR
ncbi:peptidoglycan DD-metalloendopeptidase family protein [Marinobacter sp.]|uniref:peptidoglycan DD-metalloendopeptidase family protein n=1 Tax=Marinobacter sp. TaxID=50741 RepID=UPI00384F87F4